MIALYELFTGVRVKSGSGVKSCKSTYLGEFYDDYMIYIDLNGELQSTRLASESIS